MTRHIYHVFLIITRSRLSDIIDVVQVLLHIHVRKIIFQNIYLHISEKFFLRLF